jgi:hypothetical protein
MRRTAVARKRPALPTPRQEGVAAGQWEDGGAPSAPARGYHVLDRSPPALDAPPRLRQGSPERGVRSRHVTFELEGIQGRPVEPPGPECRVLGSVDPSDADHRPVIEPASAGRCARDPANPAALRWLTTMSPGIRAKGAVISVVMALA